MPNRERKQWQPAGPAEWLITAGIVCTVIPLFSSASWTQDVKQIGLAIFVAGVLVSLRTIKDSVSEIRNRLAGLEETTTKLDNLESVSQLCRGIARFGGAVGGVAQLVSRSMEIEPPAHIRAAIRLLRDNAFEHIPAFTERLAGLYENQKDNLVLEERYVVGELLRNLVESLPNGAFWFGTTRLTDGWLAQSADPGYVHFADRLSGRGAHGEVHIFRVYCVQSSSAVEKLRQHLDKQAHDGISIRTLVSDALPDDMSLLFLPLTKPERLNHLRSSKNPLKELLGGENMPICGLKFDTRNVRSLERVEVCSGSSPHFTVLRKQFVDAWEKADRFEA